MHAYVRVYLYQEDIHELADQEARVDQLIAHVKEQLKKMVSARSDGRFETALWACVPEVCIMARHVHM